MYVKSEKKKEIPDFPFFRQLKAEASFDEGRLPQSFLILTHERKFD